MSRFRNLPRVQFFTEGPSLTKQQFKDECDVNRIMQRFKKVVGADYLSRYQNVMGGQFGDFSAVDDYRSALERVRQADDVFMALPAIVRSRFDNDPASFLDFMENPKNADEIVKLGLATKRAPTSAPSQTPAP